jgi:hypothetical protein
VLQRVGGCDEGVRVEGRCENLADASGDQLGELTDGELVQVAAAEQPRVDLLLDAVGVPEVVDHHLVGTLAEASDPADALLEPGGVPRDIDVHDDPGRLQVEPLRGGVGTEDDLDAALVESGADVLLGRRDAVTVVDPGFGTGVEGVAGPIGPEVLLERAEGAIERVRVAGEDQDPVTGTWSSRSSRSFVIFGSGSRPCTARSSSRPRRSSRSACSIETARSSCGFRSGGWSGQLSSSSREQIGILELRVLVGLRFGRPGGVEQRTEPIEPALQARPTGAQGGDQPLVVGRAREPVASTCLRVESLLDLAVPIPEVVADPPVEGRDLRGDVERGRFEQPGREPVAELLEGRTGVPDRQ